MKVFGLEHWKMKGGEYTIVYYQYRRWYRCNSINNIFEH